MTYHTANRQKRPDFLTARSHSYTFFGETILQTKHIPSYEQVAVNSSAQPSEQQLGLFSPFFLNTYFDFGLIHLTAHLLVIIVIFLCPMLSLILWATFSKIQVGNNCKLWFIIHLQLMERELSSTEKITLIGLLSPTLWQLY